ncbi:MAG: glycosyltransferase family 4 protein [Clostridiales Family XIII bacterium]|nr:glycosyltransferase family 4 protein [Clostridiales Family XIII bacterium]
MKILVLGPSYKKSKGGMATVIAGMKKDEDFVTTNTVSFRETYIDGHFLVRLFFSIYAFLLFIPMVHKFDLFHIHMASYGSTYRKMCYMQVIRLFKKNYIVHMHGAGFMVFYHKLNEAKKSKVLNLLNHASYVVALSAEWKRNFEETLGLTNVVVVQNGVATHKKDVLQHLHTEHNNAFLFLGRLGQRKGTYVLIDALYNLVKSGYSPKMYLAGDGEIEEVQRYIDARQLGAYVEIVGWIDDKMKRELLSKVNTMVLPSRHEGLPMAILESMAAGKLIISTTVGGIPSLVSKENGFLIEPDDIEALTAVLKEVMVGNVNFQKVSEANVEKIEAQYSSHASHTKLSNLYHSI